jgi:hypothetical protein
MVAEAVWLEVPRDAVLVAVRSRVREFVMITLSVFVPSYVSLIDNVDDRDAVSSAVRVEDIDRESVVVTATEIDCDGNVSDAVRDGLGVSLLVSVPSSVSVPAESLSDSLTVGSFVKLSDGDSESVIVWSRDGDAVTFCVSVMVASRDGLGCVFDSDTVTLRHTGATARTPRMRLFVRSVTTNAPSKAWKKTSFGALSWPVVGVAESAKPAVPEPATAVTAPVEIRTEMMRLDDRCATYRRLRSQSPSRPATPARLEAMTVTVPELVVTDTTRPLPVSVTYSTPL